MIDFDKLEEAEKSIRKTIELKPDYAIANYQLSIVFCKQNKLNKALLEINNAIKKDPGNHIFEGELTRIKFLCEDFEEI